MPNLVAFLRAGRRSPPTTLSLPYELGLFALLLEVFNYRAIQGTLPVLTFDSNIGGAMEFFANDEDVDLPEFACR